MPADPLGTCPVWAGTVDDGEAGRRMSDEGNAGPDAARRLGADGMPREDAATSAGTATSSTGRRAPSDPNTPLPKELDPRRGARRRPTEAGSGRRGGARPPAVRALLITGKTVGILASVAVLVTSGTLWGLYHSFRSSTHTLPTSSFPSPGLNHDATGGTSTNPNKTSQNILLVGSGSRAGLSNKQLAQVGTAASPGYATDTILLVHIPGDGSKATVVSFPRDSYVDIPGSGRTDFRGTRSMRLTPTAPATATATVSPTAPGHCPFPSRQPACAS